MTLAWLLAGLAAVASLGTSCSNGGGRPEVAAVIHGVEIASSDTEALVDAYLKRGKSQPEQQDLPRQEAAKRVLDYQIRLTLLEHLADKMGVSSATEPELDAAAGVIPQSDYRLIGQRKEDFVRELRAGRLTEAIAKKLYRDVTVPEDALRAEYERRAPWLDRSWTATARVASFGAEEPAQEVRKRVLGGEDFEAASSALGAEGIAPLDIKPATTPLPLSALDAIHRVPVGEVSAAIPVGQGFVAVLVEQRQDTPRLTLEDLRPQLTELLADRQRKELFGEWYAGQVAKAKVTVDPHYGEWSPEHSTVS